MYLTVTCSCKDLVQGAAFTCSPLNTVQKSGLPPCWFILALLYLIAFPGGWQFTVLRHVTHDLHFDSS